MSLWAVHCIQVHQFTTIIVAMVYYTHYKRPFFSLYDTSVLALHVSYSGNRNCDPWLLGKLACPRVSDNQNINVDDQKLSCSRSMVT